MTENLNGSFDLNYSAMNENLVFFQGDQSGDEYRFLQESGDGEVLPATWIIYNKIRSRVELLLGELQKRGYQITATAINSEAKARKLLQREKDRVNFNLKPFKDDLQQKSGLNFTEPGKEFQSEAEMEDYYENEYKEDNEIVITYALRHIAKRHNWAYKRIALFRDLLIMGRCAVICEMKDGMPYMRRIDPRNLIFDPLAQDDFLSDSTYFGEVNYMSLADAAAKYNLSTEQLKEAWDSYKQFLSRTSSGSENFGSFQTISGSNLSYFKSDGDKLRILAVTGYWQDYKNLKHKISKDSVGNEHIEEVGVNANSDKVESNRIAIWRKATLLGGKVLTDWGEMKNHVRQNEALAETYSPIKVLIPNYLNGRSVSKVEQLKGLQNLKDITMYNLQLAMTRAGAKGFFYDIAQLPEGWTLEDVIRYTKSSGITAFDSRVDGLPAGYNQFQEIDLTISSSIQQYLMISQMVDSEMDSISGINDARQGKVLGSSQAVGVTQSAIFQSSLATEVYFAEFQQFTSHIYDYLSGLAKIAIINGDKLDGAVGASGVQFVKDTSTLDFDDFATFVEDIPPMLDDVNMYHTALMAALQSGAINFKQYAVLVRERDPMVGLRRFERMVEMEEQKAAEAQQAQMEQAMQAEAQRQQADLQGKLAVVAEKGKYDVEKQRLENIGEMNEEMVKGKFGMAGKKIDFTKDLILQKISKQIDKSKEGITKAKSSKNEK